MQDVETTERSRRFRPAPVLLVYALSLALLLWGGLHSPYGYSDPRFVVDYFGTEVQVALMLLIATALFFAPAGIGLRLPDRAGRRAVVPLAIQLAVAASAWLVVLRFASPQAGAGGVGPLDILRTTLVVGLTEEWTYRGIVFAACAAWWGLQRGALASLVLFGALHLINIATGVAPGLALLQAGLAMLTGASLLLAAIGTRSLLLPVIAHGLYDFFVIDTGRLLAAGPAGLAGLAPLAVIAVGVAAGLYSALHIARMEATRSVYAA